MKKIFAVLISTTLLGTALPIHSLAAAGIMKEDIIIREDPDQGKSDSAEPTTEGLEKAILAVKEKIAIPAKYSDFNYNFYDTNSYSDAYWILTWRNTEDSSYIRVNCDTEYHITGFYQYDSENKTSGVAKYLKSELKSNADKFISQIAPETARYLSYQGAEYETIYNGNYTYNYIRINNGVNFPDNTVSVSVNSVTGKVTSAQINWLYQASVPSADTKVTKDAAVKLIRENMKMKLVYRSNYYRIYDNQGNSATKAYLVYEPTLNYISVDAKNGKVYLTRTEIDDNAESGFNAKKEASLASDSAVADTTRNLTDDEIAKIKELKHLISKSEAIKIVTGNSDLYLDENLTSYSATLNKTEDSRGKTNYVWNVSLSDPREIDYSDEGDQYRAYAYAAVDAASGRLLSFHSSTKSYYDKKSQDWKNVTMKYDKEKSRAILEKFLKKQADSRFSNSILAEENQDYVIYYKENRDPVYGGYRYQYNRVNEGVEYPYNYLFGSVDGITGKIYSYGSYWNDNVVFESTKGVITADQAMDYYLGKEGFGLKYEISELYRTSNTKAAAADKKVTEVAGSEYQIRLVYRPDISPAFLSPFTGEQLDGNGEVYQNKEAYAYQDIDNNSANREILLLADMDIGFEGDKFLPDQSVTRQEVLELLEKVGYGYSDSETENNNSQEITREELAKLFITKLGLEKISNLKGIYRTNYSDEENISKDNLGAVALAKGLSLMDSDSNSYFYPARYITRYEAVKYVMNFINAAQERNY